MSCHKKWIYRFLMLSCLLLALAVGVNLLVDPFDLYRLVSVSGVNQNKNFATKHSRTVKPYQIETLRPDAIVFGSSRAEVGIDPGHPGWNRNLRAPFNYALGGANIMEIADRFEQAHSVAPLQQVVLGLDFFMFNAHAGNPASDPKDGMHLSRLDLFYSTLLTVDALKGSFETLRKQNAVRAPGVLPNGQIAWTFNTRRVSRYGHRNGFERFLRHYFEEMYFPLPQKKFSLVHPVSGKRSLDAFRRIVEVARRDHIDLKLFISPMHVQLCEVIDQLGLWPQFEEWKRQMVAILQEDALVHADQQAFALWDFSGANSVTTEAVPAAGDRSTKMTYFWECSHYKTQTGDLVLDRIFNYRHPGREIPPDFGVRLTRENLERFLEETRAKVQVYRLGHPEEIRAISEIREGSTWLD